ncbi:MAG: RluA family pseudouridine synthase [Pseudomonadota bacterium]
MCVPSLSVRIAADPPSRLDKALARDVPEAAALSRSRLARLIGAGHVRLSGQVVTDAKRRVSEGDIVEITIPDVNETDMAPEAIAIDIVFEDDDLIVLNKPPGLVVHPAPGTPSGTLVNALLHHCGQHLSGVGGERRPGIVHRIDKDTSGLLVVAKTDRAHHGLAAQFEAHSVERVYQALVQGLPDPSEPRLRNVQGVSVEPGNVIKITTQLARHRTDRQRQAVTFSGGRHAITRLRSTAQFGRPPQISLLNCWLETGRTHQIRVHLAHIGHGLVGDPVYGGRRKIRRSALPVEAEAGLAGFARQALHAKTLGFVHPVSETHLRFDAPLPPDMAQLIASLAEPEAQ